jgi:hypothetical protein
MAWCSSWTLSRSANCRLFRLLCIIIIWIICAYLRTYIFCNLILRNILLSRLVWRVPSEKIPRLLRILNMICNMRRLRNMILLMLKMIDYILILRSNWNLGVLNIIRMLLISLFLGLVDVHMRNRIWRVGLHIYIVLL